MRKGRIAKRKECERYMPRSRRVEKKGNASCCGYGDALETFIAVEGSWRRPAIKYIFLGAALLQGRNKCLNDFSRNPMHIQAKASPSPRIKTVSEQKKEIVKQSDESPTMAWRGETQTKLTLCGDKQDAMYILHAKNSDTVMTRGWSCYGWGASRWDLTCLNPPIGI